MAKKEIADAFGIEVEQIHELNEDTEGGSTPDEA